MIKQLPLQLLKERDENLSFSTDITTESGKQTLELYYFFAKKEHSKVNFHKFAKQLREKEFNIQEVFNVGDIEIFTDHFNKKISANLWKINIDHFTRTGKWLSWKFIQTKVKSSSRTIPKRTIPKFLEK